MLESLMRYTSVAAAAALLLVSVSTSLHGQRAQPGVDPRSLELLTKGRAALAAGNLNGAEDALETAVAVDPGNAAAFSVLGDVARRRGLPGKAVRLYREALALVPNDLGALQGQGEALVARGAVDRAKANLAKIRTVCGKDACAPGTTLAAAIAKGPPVAVAKVTPSKVPPPPATADD